MNKTTNKSENKVTLYIGTHNKTGLRYFGKTKLYHTEELLQEKYHGSGVYWNRHLKKHGDDVTMKIYGIYNLSEVEEIALKFSEDNDIVKSINESGERKGKKVWANGKPENGLDGGFAPTYKGENHGMYGKNHSEDSKRKMSETSKGVIGKQRTQKRIEKEGRHWNTFKVKIFNENNELIFFDYFVNICKNNDIPEQAFRNSYSRDGKKIYTGKMGSVKEKWKKYQNWYAIKVKEK